MFELAEQLERDTVLVGNLPLSMLLLSKDANYPWCILVPRREGVGEIYELAAEDQKQLWRESALLGERMMRLFQGDKLNIGALGNLVPQLHLHHVVRYRTDAAWPGPIWGGAAAKKYEAGKLRERRDALRRLLADELS